LKFTKPVENLLECHPLGNKPIVRFLSGVDLDILPRALGYNYFNILYDWEGDSELKSSPEHPRSEKTHLSLFSETRLWQSDSDAAR